MPRATTVVGIFAGGQGRRMGGIDKGTLTVPGSPLSIVEHQVTIAHRLGLPCVMLGARPDWQRRLPDVPRLPDARTCQGPLAGLLALLEYAGSADAIAIACDMPYLDEALVGHLLDFESDAMIVAPRAAKGKLTNANKTAGTDKIAGGKWQPMFARYRSPLVLAHVQRCAAAGVRSFQALYATVGPTPLPLDPHQWAGLRDWDYPADMPAD